jgi:hypothetical protein
LLGKKTYGTFLSSQRRGRWRTISIGSTSAVRMMNSQIPRLRVLVASLALVVSESESESRSDDDEDEDEDEDESRRMDRVPFRLDRTAQRTDSSGLPSRIGGGKWTK